VIKRHPGFDALGQQLIHQPPIEREALLIEGARSERHDPRPGYRETVGLKVQLLHQGHIIPIAKIVLTGPPSVTPIRNTTLFLTELIPNRGTAAIDIGRAFNLKRRCRSTKEKILRKRFPVHEGLLSNLGLRMASKSKAV